MKPVQRDEIVDYQTYNDRRSGIRAAVLEAKGLRRYAVGRYLTLLFENRETVRYQVQEMMRAEKIVREAEIQHELSTYNELLGGPGALGCTLLIGIDDPPARDERLRRWLDLNRHLYLLLPDGARARATWDPRQMGEDRLSAVQYLRFDVGGQVPQAVGCDHPDPEILAERPLSPEEQGALRADLSGS